MGAQCKRLVVEGSYAVTDGAIMNGGSSDLSQLAREESHSLSHSCRVSMCSEEEVLGDLECTSGKLKIPECGTKACKYDVASQTSIRSARLLLAHRSAAEQAREAGGLTPGARPPSGSRRSGLASQESLPSVMEDLELELGCTSPLATGMPFLPVSLSRAWLSFQMLSASELEGSRLPYFLYFFECSQACAGFVSHPSKPQPTARSTSDVQSP